MKLSRIRTFTIILVLGFFITNTNQWTISRSPTYQWRRHKVVKRQDPCAQETAIFLNERPLRFINEPCIFEDATEFPDEYQSLLPTEHEPAIEEEIEVIYTTCIPPTIATVATFKLIPTTTLATTIRSAMETTTSSTHQTTFATKSCTNCPIENEVVEIIDDDYLTELSTPNETEVYYNEYDEGRDEEVEKKPGAHEIKSDELHLKPEQEKKNKTHGDHLNEQTNLPCDTEEEKEEKDEENKDGEELSKEEEEKDEENKDGEELSKEEEEKDEENKNGEELSKEEEEKEEENINNGEPSKEEEKITSRKRTAALRKYKILKRWVDSGVIKGSIRLARSKRPTRGFKEWEDSFYNFVGLANDTVATPIDAGVEEGEVHLKFFKDPPGMSIFIKHPPKAESDFKDHYTVITNAKEEEKIENVGVSKMEPATEEMLLPLVSEIPLVSENSDGSIEEIKLGNLQDDSEIKDQNKMELLYQDFNTEPTEEQTESNRRKRKNRRMWRRNRAIWNWVHPKRRDNRDMGEKHETAHKYVESVDMLAVDKELPYNQNCDSFCTCNSLGCD